MIDMVFSPLDAGPEGIDGEQLRRDRASVQEQLD
jgi:hypothetical protein